ncbi:MAG TPA: TonB-dependent receptor, partial [Thermomonas sp.]|nr:TonB-dependent receptor [Thermomonas sp.]
LKLADTDYTHTEFEGEAVGTVFHNQGREARAELVHRPVAGWKGAFGLQASQRDFVAIGDEAFVPGSSADDTGLFWIGKREFGAVQVDLGLRHDRNRVDVDAASTAADRDFRTTSASAGFGWKASDALHLSLGLDRAQRAPGAEELYSNGLHVATGSFEFGDAALGVETARRIELGLHLHHGPFEAHLSAWQARYDDFVYLAGTDAEVDGAPLRVWRQDDARFHGLEAKLDWDIADTDAGLWSLGLFGDIVRGRLAADAGSSATQVFAIRHDDHVDAVPAQVATGGNLPRIVPARAGATLRWERDAWRASLGAVRYATQDDVAAYETATPGYTLVDAHVAWHIDTRGGQEVELFLDGNNLTDREARPHTSFLKDVVPLPGRNIVFGVRAFF